jgi:hypothetical protein
MAASLTTVKHKTKNHLSAKSRAVQLINDFVTNGVTVSKHYTGVSKNRIVTELQNKQ